MKSLYPRLLSDVKKKMSSYGAIGAEHDDIDPLLAVPEQAIPRSVSASQLGVNINRRGVDGPSPLVGSVGQRQPYMFTGGLGIPPRADSTLTLDSEEDYHRGHNMALRYRLYSRLDPGGNQLRMPDHVLPSEFFSILPFDDMKDTGGKQSSIVTIFSIWNTMMGTSLLAMPWALQQAGLVLGLVIFIAMAGICLYTAYRVIESSDGLPDLPMDPLLAEFSDICQYFLGRVGMVISVCSSVAVFLGGIIVYWVLMSNFLYYTGSVVYEALQPNSSTIPIMENKTFICDVYCPKPSEQSFLWESGESPQLDAVWDWSFDRLWQLQGTVPFYLAFLAFPLFNFKSPTFFTKFNVLGTVSVMYLLIFTGSKFVECGFNMDFFDPTSIHYVQLASWKFPALTGTLTLSFFIHNAVRTILRNQRNPENNARDISIAYFLSAACYIYIAVAFYAGFPVERSCISDNFLNNFGTGDILSSTARLFLLFQMLTVLPLLMFLTRTQIFYTITRNPYPGVLSVVLLNMFIMGIAILFAVFYPKVGSILRYVGALCGLVYVFTLPNIIYMKKLHMFNRLTPFKRAFHWALVGLGLANLIAQFLV